MDPIILQDIQQRLTAYKSPKRIALSSRFPFLKRPIVWTRRRIRSIQNTLNPRIRSRSSDVFFDCVVARHQSLLRRKLGDSDPHLQEQKVKNLEQAAKALNGVIIQPADIFSLWSIIGQPRRDRGYVDGMLLSNGRVVEGIGGGLCQLSNFLFWIFLHAPVEIVERYHHSMDVFPDSGRTLPFGSGATILYNFVDLKLRNISKQPLQLKLWLTDNHLKGQLLSPERISEKFHVFEKHHCFVKSDGQYFRYNQIHRETKLEGEVLKSEHITTNFAPTLYEVTEDYLERNGFEVVDINSSHRNII